jgi:hypothetical protein
MEPVRIIDRARAGTDSNIHGGHEEREQAHAERVAREEQRADDAAKLRRKGRELFARLVESEVG